MGNLDNSRFEKKILLLFFVHVLQLRAIFFWPLYDVVVIQQSQLFKESCEAICFEQFP